MLAIIFEIIAELALQAFAELLVEMGFRSLGETFQTNKNPWLAAFGYAILGALVGGLSLLVFSDHLVAEGWRVVNLLVTPLIIGFFMALIGAWRRKRGQTVLRIDRFAYGYLFALTFAIIRFCYAK